MMNLKVSDEAMIAWRGWLVFKVHMPNKPDRYCIKAYLAYESKSGYICNMGGKNLGLELLGA